METEKLTPNSIKHWAIDDRPREKVLLKGHRVLSDAELLAIIIGSGSKNESALELSKRILQSVGNSISELGKLNVDDLIKFKGVGEAKAVTIVAALELARRRQKSNNDQQIAIPSSNDAYQYIAPYLVDLKHEEFWVFCLNRANKIIQVKPISAGGVSGTVVDVKMILKLAIDKLASGILLCHNHPSGNLAPSKSDIELTNKVVTASRSMDVVVLDHLIVSDQGYYSFADEGMLS